MDLVVCVCLFRKERELQAEVVRELEGQVVLYETEEIQKEEEGEGERGGAAPAGAERSQQNQV